MRLVIINLCRIPFFHHKLYIKSIQSLISVKCYETESIRHVLQWLVHTCHHKTTLHCERGRSAFTGATGHYFKLLGSLVEFTPLSLTALGPTFRKLGLSFSLVHLEQFYLARLDIFKMQGKGTFVPWWNESLGLPCPEQCQSTFSVYFPDPLFFISCFLSCSLVVRLTV